MGKAMFRICLRYCKNEDDAADALQEGFIKVFKHIGQFRNEGKIEGWVKQVIVRTALDCVKRKKPMLVIEDVDFSAPEYQMNIDFDTFTYNRLIDLIKSMPSGYQVVFNLFVLDGFSHKEIAKELNCSAATSRSQLFKARKMMQNLISKDGHYKELVANRHD